MNNIDRMLDTFIEGDYFIVFLILTIIVLIVLIVALIKSRQDYNELLLEKSEDKNKNEFSNNDTKIEQSDNDIIDEINSILSPNENTKDTDIVPPSANIDESVYSDEIDKYENLEEENAIISAEELEEKTRQRMDTLGLSDNQTAIQKYEEEQENKAIISYEQLLKNASNVTLSYIDETKEKGSPKINKIEIEQKEVVGTEVYLEEEEFLKILKEFRITL